jgi:hypothetical protein
MRIASAIGLAGGGVPCPGRLSLKLDISRLTTRGL